MTSRALGKRRNATRFGQGRKGKIATPGRVRIVNTRTRFEVVFDLGEERKAQVIDLVRWKPIGPLALSLAEGVKAYGLTVRRTSTRRATAGNLTSGFIQFCRQKFRKKPLTLRDLTSPLVDRFKRWLDTVKSSKTKELLEDETKRHYYSALKVLVKGLRPKLNAAGVTCEFQRSPWPDSGVRKAKWEPLEPEVYESVIKDVAVAVRKVLPLRPLIQRFYGKPADDKSVSAKEREAQARKLSVLRTIMASHNGHLPERKQLSVVERRMVDAVGYRDIRRIVYPQSDDIVPLFLFLLIFSGDNQQPLATLQVNEIRRVVLLGKKRMLLGPQKYRGRQRVRRSFVESDDELSPDKIVDLLLLWTRHVRSHAPPRLRKHLFLVASKFKARGDWVRSFGETTNGRYQLATAALGLFFKTNYEGWIGSRVLRASFADIAELLLQGDISAVAILLGHKSISMTEGAYRAKRAAERGELALAGTMTMRERLVQSQGLVDPRPLDQRSNRTAATPGFKCMDIFWSPIPGQRKGRPCSAYGRCPECFLAQRIDDPVEALARFLQLQERYIESKDDLGAQQFQEQYGESEQWLRDVHIPAVATKKNLSLASRLTLNPLPRIR